MDIWTQYKYHTEKDITYFLLKEEIDKQVRYREQVSFRCVDKKRALTSAFWGIPAFMLLLRYVTMSPLDRTFADALPVIILSLIWLIRVCAISGKHAAQYLVRDAIKSPEKPFDLLVAEDLQEKPSLVGSKMIHVLLCLTIILGGLIVPIADRLSEIRVDGMIFKPYQDGYILVDCAKDFSTAHVVIPHTVDEKTVIAIDSGAFMNEQDIISISIPETVTSIGAEAFYNCAKLESIIIPESVTEIRGNCFEYCTSLRQITLHEGITTIHGYAFRNCSSLELITLPNGITEIRGYCFENCVNLKSIVIPEGVTRIGAHAFMGCSELESVTVPSTVQEVGSSAFRQCPKLLFIDLPEGVLVDERSFKESPTTITYSMRFTEEEIAAMNEEFDNRKVDILYYIYQESDGADTVWFAPGSNVICIADDPRFVEMINDQTKLAPMQNYGEVLEYLTLAKEQGATGVRFSLYSQVGTDIKGVNVYTSYDISIDEMSSWAKNIMAG